MYVQMKKVQDCILENEINQLEKQGIFLNNHCTTINCAVVSDDLKYLVTGSGSFRCSDDCSIRIWDLTTSQQVFSLKYLPKRVTHISISADNSFVFATLENKSLYYAELWSSSPIKHLLEIQSNIVLTSILSNDYGLFLTHEGKFWLLNFHTNECLLIISDENGASIELMALKKNCFAFGTKTGVLNVCYYENSFVNEPFTVCKGRIKGLHFDNEGKFLMFTALKDKGSKIFIWDVEAKCVFRKIKIEDLNVLKICYSCQLNILAVRFHDSIRIWDFNNENGFKALSIDLACDFFLVKDYLIVIFTGVYNYKNRITVYSIQDMKKCYDFDGHIGVVTCIKTDKAKNFLATSSLDGQVLLWDLKSKKVIRKFLGHTEGVISLDFDDNHVYVASGSLEKSCRIWDFNTGNTIEVIRENDNWVTDVKVAPNHKFIAFACCSRNVINVYDIEKKKKRAMNLIENFCVNSMGIQRNCKYAVVCGTGCKTLVLKL